MGAGASTGSALGPIGLLQLHVEADAHCCSVHQTHTVRHTAFGNPISTPYTTLPPPRPQVFYACPSVTVSAFLQEAADVAGSLAGAPGAGATQAEAVAQLAKAVQVGPNPLLLYLYFPLVVLCQLGNLCIMAGAVLCSACISACGPSGTFAGGARQATGSRTPAASVLLEASDPFLSPDSSPRPLSLEPHPSPHPTHLLPPAPQVCLGGAAAQRSQYQAWFPHPASAAAAGVEGAEWVEGGEARATLRALADACIRWGSGVGAGGGLGGIGRQHTVVGPPLLRLHG